MHNYKALKSASKVSVRKVKVIDEAKADQVKDDDGNIISQAHPEQSHEELQVVCKKYDSDTGEALDDSVRAYRLLELESIIDQCKSKITKLESEQAEWEQLEKDLKAL